MSIHTGNGDYSRIPEIPDYTANDSVEGDARTVTDESGEQVGELKRVYVSHWWVWSS
jgi:hypothetical protein